MNIPTVDFVGEEEKYLDRRPRDRRLVIVCPHGNSLRARSRPASFPDRSGGAAPHAAGVRARRRTSFSISTAANTRPEQAITRARSPGGSGRVRNTALSAGT